MSGSHDMRHTGFHILTMVNETPGSGHHIFGDEFGLFWGFWLYLWKNGRNQQNMGNFGGPTLWRRDPHAIA